MYIETCSLSEIHTWNMPWSSQQSKAEVFIRSEKHAQLLEVAL